MVYSTFSVFISIPITYGWDTKPPLGRLVHPNYPLNVGLRGHRDLYVQSFDQYSMWVHLFYSLKVSSFKVAYYPTEVGDTQ